MTPSNEMKKKNRVLLSILLALVALLFAVTLVKISTQPREHDAASATAE